MSGEGDVWLGDAARAFAALHPTDDATRAAIAVLLGLSVSAPAANRCGLRWVTAGGAARQR